MAASRRKQKEVAERRAQALKMRAEGRTYQELADALGYAGPAAAAQDVTRALATRKVELAGTKGLLLYLELDRLDRLDVAANKLLADTSNPENLVYDPGLAARVIDRLVRISARRSALLNLDNGSAAGLGTGDDDETPSRLDEIAAARARRIAQVGDGPPG